MGDLPIPGLVLSPDALKMKLEIEKSECTLRIQKLHLRKLEVEMEVKKIEFEIQTQTDRLKSLGETKEGGK